MVAASPGRVRGELARLAQRGLDVPAFSLAAARVLARAVPFDGVCVLTTDPATLLPTGEVVENGLPVATMARLGEIELREPDFNKFTALAHARTPVATLAAATDGRLDRSLRQRELRRPSGFDDELRAVLISDAEAWGALTLLRERGRPHFTPAEVRRVAAVTRHLGEGLRRALLPEAPSQSDDGAVGQVLLAEDGSVELADPTARTLLDELAPDGNAQPHELPPVVLAVAHRARSIEAGRPPPDGLVARARIRARTGRWLMVHGSVLGVGPTSRVAVMLQPARPPDLAPLVASAYGLTERERQITRLIARGLSTSDIAAQLHLSAWTVQDHLKATFTKTGTSSRGELVARIFFDHYAPRLHDERRPSER